jgi:hypothetical protein
MRYTTVRRELGQRGANRCEGVEPGRFELVPARRECLAGKCATMGSSRSGGARVRAKPSFWRAWRQRCLTPPSSGRPPASFAGSRPPLIPNVRTSAPNQPWNHEDSGLGNRSPPNNSTNSQTNSLRVLCPAPTASSSLARTSAQTATSTCTTELLGASTKRASLTSSEDIRPNVRPSQGFE